MRRKAPPACLGWSVGARGRVCVFWRCVWESASNDLAPPHPPFLPTAERTAAAVGRRGNPPTTAAAICCLGRHKGGGQRSNKCGRMELLSHVNVAVNKAASFQSCRGGDGGRRPRRNHGGGKGNRKWCVGLRWRQSGGVLARHKFSKYVTT